MTKPQFWTTAFIQGLIRYALCFAAVAITPLVASLFAPLFDMVAYSTLRALFTEVFTLIFWGIEVLVFGILKKKRVPTVALNEEKKEPKPLLPIKKVWILTAICVGCILIMSAVIRFQVKIFYDFGEKFTGMEMLCKIGALVRNAVKCLWIVAMIKACKQMATEVVKAYEKKTPVWLWTGLFLLVFALFDIFTSAMSYPLNGRQVLIGLTYLLFYGSFVAVYDLTEESFAKSYFLVMLIYLF